MFKRCKFCNDKCPDYSDVCNTCATIEDECREIGEDIERMLEDENNCS